MSWACHGPEDSPSKNTAGIILFVDGPRRLPARHRTRPGELPEEASARSDAEPVAAAVAPPRHDLVAVARLGIVGAVGVQEESLHALHLVLDEQNVAPDAAQKLRLVDEEAAQLPQQRAHRALGHHIHLLVHS